MFLVERRQRKVAEDKIEEANMDVDKVKMDTD
jgi:hypothetical protein